MTHPVRFLPEASSELAAAARWYEDWRPGLGDRFVHGVDETVESIARWPRIGQMVDAIDPRHDVRRAPIQRFPYHVGYLVTADQIIVLAIAHDRRRPTYWSGRIV